MLRLVPADRNAVLFCFPNGSPVTYAFYQKFLENCIKCIGFNQSNFNTQSFRRGAVSWAIKCGIPEHMIQVMGDWKSDHYKMYVNCPLEVRCDFASRFNVNLSP